MIYRGSAIASDAARPLGDRVAALSRCTSDLSTSAASKGKSEKVRGKREVPPPAFVPCAFCLLPSVQTAWAASIVQPPRKTATLLSSARSASLNNLQE